MCPQDPHKFIIDKLKYIKENGLECIEWDMFVEEHMRPKKRFISNRGFDFLFGAEEEDKPTSEMFSKAYEYFNTQLKQKGLNALIENWIENKTHREQIIGKVVRIKKQREFKLMQTFFGGWRELTQQVVNRYSMAQQHLDHVSNVQLCAVVFTVWHHITQDSIRQREYFERLERGEKVDDEERLLLQGYTGEAQDSISTLPRKLAVQIFSYLDVIDLAHCSRVCRSWKILTQMSSLWNSLNLHQIKNRLTDSTARKLLNHCRPYLIHLNLRGCTCLREASFLAISACSNLQDLNLSECTSLTDSALLLIAQGCHILLYLNISHTSITDSGMRTIARYFGNLQFLSLAFCYKFTDKGMMYLAESKCCKNLEHLDLSGCLQLTPLGFKQLSGNCDQLKTFIVDDFPTLTDGYIQDILQHTEKLTHISFLGSPLLTDLAFKRLPQSKYLNTVKIEGNQRISDVTIKQLSRLCTSLTHIYLGDCQRLTDNCLKYLATCKHLTVLNMAECIRITDSGIRSLGEGVCTAKLRELNLSNCIRLGDMSVVSICKKLQNLAYLNLSFCENINESVLELLGQAPSLISLDISGCSCGDQGLSAIGNGVHLKDLTASECNGVTDLGLQKFAKQCEGIERVDLSHCVQITDAAIKNLAFCCRLLSCIKLSGCKHLTDLSLQYLSGVCHYIISLDISGCTLITDKGIRFLRKGCHWLRILNILYCKGISKSAAQKMMKSIEIVHYSTEDTPASFKY